MSQVEERVDLRKAMPGIAKRVDELREKFGAAYVNAGIKRGLAGEPGWFYAIERGHTLGTPFPVTDVAMSNLQKYAVLVQADFAVFMQPPGEGVGHAN